MSTTKRISLTISSDVLDSIDYLCNKLSVSRSSLISEFLRPTVDDVRRVVDFVLPSDSDPDTPKARDPEILRDFLKGVALERMDAAGDEYKAIVRDWEVTSDGSH